MKNIITNTDYDHSKWIYVPGEYRDYRHILGTVGEHPLLAMGINPSTAVPEQLDPTLKAIRNIAQGNGFDSFVACNVYSQRATDPNNMDQEMNVWLHEDNLKEFEKLLKNCKDQPVMWAAWGTLIYKRKYLKGCLTDLVEVADRYHVRWCKVGKTSKDGHPHHPLYLKKDSKIEDFDIHEYLRNLK